MNLLVLSEPGKVVRKDGGIAFVGLDGKVEYLGNNYDVIVIASSKISVTSAAMRIIGKWNVDLMVLDWNGEPVLRSSSPIPNKSAMTRLKQYEVILKGNGLKYAKPIIKRKIVEQGRTLRYVAKSKRSKWLIDESYILEKYVTDVDKARDAEELRSLEALAARLYWSLLAQVIEGFEGRDHEGRDAINASLNYLYGILYSKCFKALTITGLDPYAGLFHAIKSGNKSLVYDFSEQFKPVYDKRLFGKLRELKPKFEGGTLAYETRKKIGEIVNEYMDNEILTEAWNLVTSIRNAQPYVPGWRA
ncbi:CRISPR-associated protein Cas1 [Ignicoccus islandicus DSM 13165]|uniref:CRISPR-associated endonuclease Cas1 n=1 Tax=Ignicoccus islandicus DSM 13165 TaxID=940295 RepID=A0A0U3F2S4_9CREN|nr:CRISPR-associated endonuclease Cas1 [Ignicoccus islandicus]ALU11829.1 CRISPR-associated protein Cas1 [Ignicoccus islandicus DSM 13165]